MASIGHVLFLAEPHRQMTTDAATTATETIHAAGNR